MKLNQQESTQTVKLTTKEINMIVGALEGYKKFMEQHPEYFDSTTHSELLAKIKHPKLVYRLDSHMTMTPSLAEYGDLKPYLAPISEEGCYTHIHYQPHDKDSLCPHHATASIELIYCCPEWAPTDNCEEVYITVFEDDWGKVLNSTISQS